MADHDFDRRDFHKWTMAAFSGVLAGTAVGCAKPAAPPAKPAANPAPAAGTKPAVTLELTDKQVELLTDEVHTCRGLNVCKGKGRSK